MNRDKKLIKAFINSPVFLESYDPLDDVIDTFLASPEYKELEVTEEEIGRKSKYVPVMLQSNEETVRAWADGFVSGANFIKNG